VPTAVGIPKEIKDQEGRVSMQPDAVVDELHHGHEVNVHSGASNGSGFSVEEYESAGGRVVESADEVFEAADLIVKVKEPIPEEYYRFREGQELFTYSPSGGGQGVPRVPDGAQDQRTSVRGGRASRWEPAASRPDERGGREDVGPRRGALLGEHAGWGRAPSGWQPRLRAGRRGPRPASYLPRAGPRLEQE
jgi:hypothetical protein